jgi:hypothetical protein
VGEGYWSEASNQRLYLDWLGVLLGYTRPDDWYRISYKQIAKNRGLGILRQYKGSPSSLVSSVFSEHIFSPWLFRTVPKGYFKVRENRRRYVEWLRAAVGVASTEELDSNNYVENHGRGLLVMYGGSPQRIYESLDESDARVEFSDASNRSYKSHRYWFSIENQRAYADKIGVEIGVREKDLSPWYNVTSKKLFRKFGGPGLLHQYRGSLSAMLRKIYPEYDWLPWRFKRISSHVDQDPAVIRKLLSYIESEGSVAQPTDWYSVKNLKLKQLGVYSFVVRMGGLYQLLSRSHPEISWDKRRLTGDHRKTQLAS